MPKRDYDKREQDLARLAQIVARRRTDDVDDPKSQDQIAKTMGVSQRQISADLKELRARWRKSALADIGELVAQQRAEITELIREAYAEWERSKVDKSEETRERVANEAKSAEGATPLSAARTRLRATTKTSGGIGNPQFLSIIREALADERALLGLNRPTKIAPTSPDGLESYSTGRKAAELTDDELAAIVAGRSAGTTATTQRAE
jgi:predicted transcriptional regulator